MPSFDLEAMMNPTSLVIGEEQIPVGIQSKPQGETSRYKHGLLGQNSMHASPATNLNGISGPPNAPHIDDQSTKKQKEMTRDYFNFAFRSHDDENVVDKYTESVLTDKSIARDLIKNYLEKNEWPPDYMFNDVDKEDFYDSFIQQIKPVEMKYRIKMHNNPNDTNNKAILIRNFNRIMSEELTKKNWPFTLDDGLKMMMKRKTDADIRFKHGMEKANEGNLGFSHTEATPPTPPSESNIPKTSWWRWWPRSTGTGQNAGRRTKKNSSSQRQIKSRRRIKSRRHNIKKTHARKSKQRSRKRVVRRN
jgi:hypothetical protein